MVLVEFMAPVKIESEMNKSGGHWSVRRARFAEQKKTVFFCWPKPCYREYIKDGFNLVVTLTRLASRKFDTDNLTSGFKAVRDEIARVIGIDDGSERIQWRYLQQRQKNHAIRVRIERVVAMLDDEVPF